MNFLSLVLAASLTVVPALSWALGGAAATVASVEEGAEVLLDGVEPWVPATVGQQLTSGSQVRTGKKGQAILLFFDGTKIRLNKSTQFTIESAQPSSIAVRLGLGRFEAWVAKLKGRKFQARTGSMVAAVRGTVFAMTPTSVDLFSGGLSVGDTFGRTLTLTPGQSMTAQALANNTGPTPVQGTAPAEPTVNIAPPPAPPPAGDQQTSDAPPPPPDGSVPPPPPPPNPQQNTQTNCDSTVSGSTPCP